MHISDQEPPMEQKRAFKIFIHPETGLGPWKDITEAVISCYDRLLSSMDFGSGFLSTEEIAHLKQIGKAIGAEPFYADSDMCHCGHTHGNHYKHWPEPYKPINKCYWCPKEQVPNPCLDFDPVEPW